MKQILLFGAGKSATVLIEYLLKQAEAEHWKLVVVDQDAALVKLKLGNSVLATALSFDIKDETQRKAHILESDLVISLLPPALHNLLAGDCLEAGRHLLTASYVDSKMLNRRKEITDKHI